MPIAHDPHTGKFVAGGGSTGGAKSSRSFKKGALVKENRIGAKTMEVFESRGNMLFVAPKHGPNSYGGGEWVHKTKFIKA